MFWAPDSPVSSRRHLYIFDVLSCMLLVFVVNPLDVCGFPGNSARSSRLHSSTHSLPVLNLLAPKTTGKMGLSISSLLSSLTSLMKWSKEQDVRILMLGLDSAGKTTILYRLQIGEVVSTIPTIGFNVETVQFKNIKFQVWDLGGQSSIRPYWRCYFPNTSAIIYVIDSSDHARLSTSRTELLTMLSEPELNGVPLLVFCNKQDIAEALKPEDISEKLGLAGGEKTRQWSVRGCCATKGEGLEEGLDWLVNAIQQK